MPIGVPFKDSAGLIGAKFVAPKSEKLIKACSDSRSLEKMKVAIHCEFKRSRIILDVSDVIGHRIRLSVKDAKLFANWILEVTNKKRKKNG